MGNNASSELNKQFYDRLAQAVSGVIAEEVLGYIIFPLLERFIGTIKIPRDKINVLDIGAGDTGIPTEYLLKLGLKVTETDISEASLTKLKENFCHYDDQLELQVGDVFEVLNKYKSDNRKFEMVIARSFLHHIPDTAALMSNIEQIISENGCFISFADPLRYDTVSNITRYYEKIGYFIWRIKQGNLLRGFRSLVRRSKNEYDTSKEEDMVEYHVVRNGVDHVLIKDFWSMHNYKCEIIPYFWSPTTLFTIIGRIAKFHNGFATYAYKKC